ncbi:MAG: hypothetical protein AAGI24_11895 [Pseudomonadota bacterium]
MDIERLQAMLPHKVFNRRVRKAAIRRVRKDLILHGKSEQDLSQEELEYLVADAETDVKGDLQKAGLLGALALLGLGGL